jgi:hypothetical protein
MLQRNAPEWGRLSFVWAGIMFLFLALSIDTSAQSADVEVRHGPIENAVLQQPPNSDGSPVMVSIALVLLNITDIDEVLERFHVNAYLFMRWHDSRLKYAQTSPQLKATKYSKGAIWSPTVELLNAVDPRYSVHEGMIVTTDGVVSYTERFSAAATSSFALRSFPFDSQTLNLVFRPYVGERKDFSLTLDHRRSKMVPEVRLYSSLASWDVERLGARAAIVEASDGGPVTEARFQISIRRKSDFYMWKVILPLLLMVMLSWAVFWIEADDVATQVQIAVTTVLTIIAFAFAISGSLPRVSYLTFIDVFFLTCYLFVFIAIAELMSVHVSHRTRGSDTAERIRWHARWLVPIAFLVANALTLVEFKII